MIILTILLVILLIIVVLAALIFGGTFAFVYFRYDVNIFNILSDIDKLNKTVDVEKLTPNAFDESDYISIKIYWKTINIYWNSIKYILWYTKK